MIDTLDTQGPAQPPPALDRDRRRAVARRWSVLNVVVAGVILVGSGMIAYPSAATWITDLTHATTLSGYAQTVSDTASSERETVLDSAHDYNERLPGGPLRDPFTLDPNGDAVDVEAGRDEYLEQLSLSADAPIARIRVPAIDVDLPVYHGTEEKTLARGIGHLYGSSLPVGGADTHSVLTGHSGLPEATLFTRLHELKIGDTILIDVAGETLAYRVDQTKTVLPDDGADLRQVAGEDYITLLTCTPTGVNTHRLLVRAERVDMAAVSPEIVELPSSGTAPAVPWSAIVVLLVGLGLALAVALPRAPRRGHLGPGSQTRRGSSGSITSSADRRA